MTPDQIIKAVAELDGFKIEELDHPQLRHRTIFRVKNRDGRLLLHKWTTYGECDSERIGSRGLEEHHSGYDFQDLRDVVKALPPYLSSRDAIIPVIERRGNIQLIESSCVMKYKLRSILEATPAQLCEALLRAANKWIEE